MYKEGILIFFWIIASILLFAIRKTGKTNRLHNRSYLDIYCIILMIIPTILSCTSSPTISEKMNCEIEYKSYRKSMVTFYIDFKNENTLNLSNSTFLLVSRKSAMKD